MINGQTTSQSYMVNGKMKISYDYGQLDNLQEQKLTITGLDYGVEYTKTFDKLNNRITNTRLSAFADCLSTVYKDTNYYYNDDGLISNIKFNSKDFMYSYDDLGRITNKTIPGSYFDVQNEQYSYKSYSLSGSQYDTTLLDSIDDQTSENNDSSATYDSNGYVTSATYNGKTHTYTYDSVGRLIKETAIGINKTYQYNDKNDITNTGYVYTNGKLTRVNGLPISYDAMGNPTTYKGNQFIWKQGRKLTSGTMNGNSFSYAYDSNGMRYKKTVNSVTTEYYYNGSQLLFENKNGARTYYIYDLTGVAGMIYNEAYYFFDKNTLGDIIAIRNRNGQKVATYSYDAWGNVTVTDGYGFANTNSTFVGNVNPFRYRGYYYDTETGFYYLQTRYYDPTICRFINADNYELVASLSCVPGQLNMYAYCGNNPIMYTDESGEGIFFVLFLAAFTVVGAGVGLGVGISLGHEGWQLVGDIALGAAAGLFTGSLAASIFGAYGVVAGKALILGMKPISTWALGSAIYDLLGFTFAPILRIDFIPIEYDGGKDYDMPDNMPPAIIRPYSTYVVGDYYG